jgi:hypothetical protein
MDIFPYIIPPVYIGSYKANANRSIRLLIRALFPFVSFWDSTTVAQKCVCPPSLRLIPAPSSLSVSTENVNDVQYIIRLFFFSFILYLFI